MVQCMWGTDNESAFPIFGCYATWTFSGLPSASGLAVPPLLCVTFPLCVRDQLFIDDLCKQLVAELRAACQLNANPGAKPKSGDTKTDLIYKRAFCNYL